jgi:hypothetical protein
MHAHSATQYKNEKNEKFPSFFTNWTRGVGYRNNDVITLMDGALFIIYIGTVYVGSTRSGDVYP